MSFLKSDYPRHIGIILDGNRRWAASRGLSKLAGHRAGYKNIKKIALAAFENNVDILTVFAFSTENWRREQAEVDYLLKLFRLMISKEIKTLARKGVRVNFFGRRSDFDQDLQSDMIEAERQTRDNKRGVLNICLSYGGRDEIVRAVRNIIARRIPPVQLTEDLISANLDSAWCPDPDLIIRTSGEERLSGFLTWQSVYSELLFIKKYWPDFTEEDLLKAINEYRRRQRRYGK